MTGCMYARFHVHELFAYVVCMHASMFMSMFAYHACLAVMAILAQGCMRNFEPNEPLFLRFFPSCPSRPCRKLAREEGLKEVEKAKDAPLRGKTA